MLKLNEVRKSYGATVALESLSLDVRPGEVCTVTFFLTVNTQDSLMVY